MTEEEKKDHARRIGKAFLQSFDILGVWEDDDLPENVTEDEMAEIYNLITTGEVVVD